MPVPKGTRIGGRQKGSRNKATLKAREAIAHFVDSNAPKFQGWLDEIAASEGPRAAFECVLHLVEYHVPKLARTELTGRDGKDLEVLWPLPKTLLDQ